MQLPFLLIEAKLHFSLQKLAYKYFPTHIAFLASHKALQKPF